MRKTAIRSPSARLLCTGGSTGVYLTAHIDDYLVCFGRQSANRAYDMHDYVVFIGALVTRLPCLLASVAGDDHSKHALLCIHSYVRVAI